MSTTLSTRLRMTAGIAMLIGFGPACGMFGRAEGPPLSGTIGSGRSDEPDERAKEQPTKVASEATFAPSDKPGRNAEKSDEARPGKTANAPSSLDALGAPEAPPPPVARPSTSPVPSSSRGGPEGKASSSRVPPAKYAGGSGLAGLFGAKAGGPREDRVSREEFGDDEGEATAGESGRFEGREIRYNAPTVTREDRQSTFAVDVDTAAYSIARRTLKSDRMPTASLVRVEELINYFHYDYEPPTGERHPFSIQADGARSPVDGTKHLLRVGVQARTVADAERLHANLVFLVDTSCSMTSDDKLELAKKSLKIAVDRLTEKDMVAITTYAGGVEVVLRPTSADQKAVIKRAIDSLRPGGGTAMESGLTLAYKQAAKMLRDDTITRIIVCSDGDANIGATSPQEMLKQVEGYVSEGVTLSTIGYGDGNYKDATMEQIANKGNGNYYYIDTIRQAERVFGRDLTKMIQDVAQDVKIQVEFDPAAVESYRLVGYENRDIADRDFRNDKVDAGEIGAGHQVTALYELTLNDDARKTLATIRVRAKEPRGTAAKETSLEVPVSVVEQAFERAPSDLRFATAVMGGAELLRLSPHAKGWTYARVISIVSDTDASRDPDRAEFLSLMKKAAWLSGESPAISARE